MITFSLEHQDDSIKTTHIKFHQLCMDILSTINPVLTDLYVILQSNEKQVNRIKDYENNTQCAISQDAIAFKDLCIELQESLINHCPPHLPVLFYEDEIDPYIAQEVLNYFEETYTKYIINEKSKELFWKLCSLLEQSINLDKNIIKEED